MRVALVFEGLRPAEEAFSGIPWGLGQGLGELGHDAVFVRAAAPRAIERPYRMVSGRLPAAMLLAPELARVRTAVTGRRLRRVGRIDAIVQLATGFLLPAHPRLATYEDMTVVQAVRDDTAYGVMPRRARAAWIARQRACYGAARACLTLSSWTADSIVRDYGVPESHVSAVGAGRNLDPQPVEREWWPPRYLFVGLDWQRKNGDGLLRGFARLRERIPEARLTLVGAHPPIEAPGVAARGSLSARVPTEKRALERLFEGATCFVMPSHVEPFGMVYEEAGAAGIPSIGTTVGGALDAVGDGGLCVDPFDDDALLEAMLHFADPEIARATGRRAAARRGETSWRAVAARVSDALGLVEEAPVTT
jgi:glycosyltransferase involved in cell wall biosynthesis